MLPAPIGNMNLSEAYVAQNAFFALLHFCQIVECQYLCGKSKRATPLAKYDEQKSASRRMPNSDETIFTGTMLWIKKLNRFRINPNGLRFFEPYSVFFEIGPVLVLIPLESHIMTVFYSIYYSQLQRESRRGKAGSGCRAKGPTKSPCGKSLPILTDDRTHVRL